MDKIVSPNPLEEREKAMENQWIKEKEYTTLPLRSTQIKADAAPRQKMARDRAAKAQEAKGASDQGQQSNQEKQ